MGKGADNERNFCRYLSLWWTDGKDPDVFWRKRTRLTSRKGREVKYQLGDIVAEKSEGDSLIRVFNIELKTGYSKNKKGKSFKNVPWDLLDLIDYQKSSSDLSKKQINVFWSQTLRDSKISERIPLLVFKRDYHQEVVCIRDEDLKDIESLNGQFQKMTLAIIPPVEDVLILLQMKEFFEWLSPETVRMMYDRKNNRKNKSK